MGRAVRGILTLLVGLILIYTSLPVAAYGQEEQREGQYPAANEDEVDRIVREQEGRYRRRNKRLERKKEKKGIFRKAISALGGPPPEEIDERKLIISPYSTTEEVLLPWEIGALRRQFVTTEPRYTEGRMVEEQSVFEALARQEERQLYYGYAIKELEKPWWRDLLEGTTAIVNYEQAFYTNYFNDRARRDLWTEKPFFGLRVARWSVLSVDVNSFLTLERLTSENKISLDPHVLKTIGGQARILYRPSRRFHLLVLEEARKSNKITAVDDRLNNISTGSNAASNRIGTRFRYFLTARDVIDLTFDYDYSRVVDSGDQRISRGYRPKLAFIRSFGRRVILRGFWLHDTLLTKNLGTSTTTFRQEPGLGGTFVLGKRLVMDADYSKQYVRPRSSRKTQRGDRVQLRLNHQLTRRLTHSNFFEYSRLEGKRSAISKIGGGTPGTFGSLTMGSQFGYALTKLMTLSVTLDYTHTFNKGSEFNNRKRIVLELSRPIFKNRAGVILKYEFNRNNGEILATYKSHVVTLGIGTKWGVGREQ